MNNEQNSHMAVWRLSETGADYAGLPPPGGKDGCQAPYSQIIKPDIERFLNLLCPNCGGHHDSELYLEDGLATAYGCCKVCIPIFIRQFCNGHLKPSSRRLVFRSVIRGGPIPAYFMRHLFSGDDCLNEPVRRRGGIQIT